MKRIVFGVVMEPNTVDLQGDIITEEEIEKAAHKYMVESRITGFRHESELDACIVELYIHKQDENINGELVTKGSCSISMKINDDTVWQGVLEGKYNSFSIGGFAESTPIDDGIIDMGGG